MNIWIRQHLAAIGSAMKQVTGAPGNFLFNILVVAVTLALPVTGLTLIENIRPVSAQLIIDPELSLFLKTDVSRPDAVAFADTIRQMIKKEELSANVTFIPREKALTSLEISSELGDVLGTLGENPLPDAYVLSFGEQFDLSPRQADPAKIAALAAQFQKLPEVGHVQIDSDWIKRLAALMSLAQFMLIAVAITLSVVVVIVVSNATRLQVLSHHAEIAVIRLLGATNQYLHRPYYYIGAFLGLAAGSGALAIVAVGLYPLNQALLKLASLYGVQFQLSPLNSTFSFYVLLSSALLGLFGASLSVWHQLRAFSRSNRRSEKSSG